MLSLPGHELMQPCTTCSSYRSHLSQHLFIFWHWKESFNFLLGMWLWIKLFFRFPCSKECCETKFSSLGFEHGWFSSHRHCNKTPGPCSLWRKTQTVLAHSPVELQVQDYIISLCQSLMRDAHKIRSLWWSEHSDHKPRTECVWLCERDKGRERENGRFRDTETDRVELSQSLQGIHRITDGLPTKSNPTAVHSTSQYCHLGDCLYLGLWWLLFQFTAERKW